MNPKTQLIRRSLIAPLLLVACSTTLHAQIVMDGVRNSSESYAELSVQATTSNWGGGNTLANLHAVQEGSSLGVFLGGRVNGNAFILFIDSKSGGRAFIANNTITTGGDEYTINNLGSSSTSGMTFEDGFTPDYAVRIYGTGSDAYVNTYDLQTGARDYFGQSGGTTVSGSGFLAAIRTNWADVAGATADASNGVEIKLNLQQLGVPALDGQSVKMMALLVNGGSDYASNQVLGSRTSSTADIGGGRNSINFEAEAGTQTISTVVNLGVPDNDQDGIADADDPDDDNDGLADTVETDTGLFVDADDTGTDPLVADTDGDGVNDGAEVAAGTNPLKVNHAAITVAGSFLNPTWTPAPGNGNDMTPIEGDEFGWSFDKEFFDLNAYEGKITAGTWALNWGTSGTPGVLTPNGGNIPFQANTYGIWRITFNTDTLVFTFDRAFFTSYQAFATAYGLTGGMSDDDDFDGLNNIAEFELNTHPLYSDTDGDGSYDGEDLYPLVDDNTDGDLDNDGLLDEVETNTGVFVDDTNTGTAPGDPDSDGDGYSDYNEVYGYSNLGFVSDPNVANYALIAVAGNFTDTNPDDGIDSNWRPDGTAGNAMTRLGESFTDQHQWSLSFRFLAPRSIEYKYAAGSWDKNWGTSGGGNFSATIAASGIHTFSFNSATLDQSVTRAVFVDVTAFLTAYGLDSDPDGDADSDGLTNSAEFTGNTDPTNADTDGDGVNDATDTDPLQSSRDVTFSVDMAVVITNGGFDPSTDSVVVKFFSGVAAGQSDLELTQVGDSTVYSGTLSGVVGPVGASFGTYKFFNTTAGAPNSGYEFGSDRTFDLGASNETQVLTTVYFSDEAPPSTQTRDVTFAVNMNVQIANGVFDPATQGVEVRGSFNSYAGGSSLADDDEDGIYTGTFAIVGDEGSAVQYKFYGTGDGGLGYETMTDNRSATLGADGVAQALDTVYFNDQAPPPPPPTEFRDVTFAVNMNVQITNTLFDPATQGVEVRGSFNDWAGTTLSDDDADGIYTGTVSVGGSEGATIEYKYFGTGEGGLGYETIQDNRSVALGAADTPQVLDTVYFNDQAPPPPPPTRDVTFAVNMSVQITNGVFNPATQGVEVRGSFNNYSGGSSLADDDADGIYTGTFAIIGDEESAVQYKFYGTGDGGLGYETMTDNRSATLGADGVAQTLDTVYFNNELPPQPTRDVTYYVNLSVYITNNVFNPDTMGVELRGDFNGWSGTIMDDSDGDGIYAVTVAVIGNEGDMVDHKFYGTGEGGLGYEALAENRRVTLGPVNQAQTVESVYFNNVTPPEEETRQVVFSVDMSVQIASDAFLRASDGVEVRGSFNGWSSGSTLADDDGDGIYTGTFAIVGAEGSFVEYKFYSTGALSWESVANRSSPLDAAGVTQTLSTVYFNDVAPPSQQFRDVTFSVDMSVQITNGAFDPNTEGVEVRGPFNGWSGTALTNVGNGIYTGTVSVQGDEGAVVEYKFFSTGTLSWESVDNRSFALGADAVAQDVPVSYFNNQEPPPPSSGFSDWADANAGGGAFGDDSDGDGIPNGTEYFFGETSPGPTLNPVPDANGLIIWPRDPNATGVSFRIESSSDLANWTDDTAAADLSNPNEIRYTLQGVDRAFVRLVVTEVLGDAGSDNQDGDR